VTLGRYSMAKFLPNAKISAVHGQAVKIKDRLVVPMYHPAAALHQPSLKSDVVRDFAHLPELIAKTTEVKEYVEEKTPEEKYQPKQLSLF
jgi:DNA polymerase